MNEILTNLSDVDLSTILVLLSLGLTRMRDD